MEIYKGSTTSKWIPFFFIIIILPRNPKLLLYKFYIILKIHSLNLVVILGNKDKEPYVNIFVHVIVGTLFITVGAWRIINYQLTTNHHNGFEAAILYWHFVDVVWIFLFIAIYYWGGF